MKLAFALGAVLGLYSFLGAGTVQNAAPGFQSDLVELRVPAWLQLPESEFVTSIEYTGELGEEAARGNVLMNLPSDGDAEMAWLAEHFRAQGYHVTHEGASLAQIPGVVAVVVASESLSERRVTIIQSQDAEGASIRLSFEDPMIGAQVSAL